MDERGRERERDSPKRIKWGYGPLEGNKLDAPLPPLSVGGSGRTDRVSPNSTIEAREGGGASIEERPRPSSMHGGLLVDGRR